MKHEIEINKLLKELFYDESWMDDNDYKEVIELTFKTTGITKQKLSDSIETGIKNGYNVEQQIELLRKYLNAGIDDVHEMFGDIFNSFLSDRLTDKN